MTHSQFFLHTAHILPTADLKRYYFQGEFLLTTDEQLVGIFLEFSMGTCVLAHLFSEMFHFAKILLHMNVCVQDDDNVTTSAC